MSYQDSSNQEPPLPSYLGVKEQVKEASLAPKLISCKINQRKHMVVLGATSHIAIATLEQFALKEAWHFSLCGRNLDELKSLKQRLENRFNAHSSANENHSLGNKEHNISCSIYYFDTAFNDDEHIALSESLIEEKPKLGIYTVDALFCAVGYLGNQAQAQIDNKESNLILERNYTGLIPLIAYFANYFVMKKAGHIMVISSVAGDRGRCSNYCYGAAKAAMSAYLSGLRVRLFNHNVHVINIKPGYVKTRMVSHKSLPPYISASAKTVAKDIVKSYYHPKAVVYTMWLWRYIMIITKILPDFIFKRLNMF